MPTATSGVARTMCIGQSGPYQEMLRAAQLVAGHDATVLIQGETGTGKELLARYIHDHSKRAAGTFVPADCTNFSEHLFESQLFGHVRGAFTGALRDSLGCARAAHRGTLFLDELGELPLTLQAKLLRLLQERAVTPMGDTRQIPVDIRVLAATNRNLEQMVSRGSFREDLYYRLKVVCIGVPNLRQRSDDILPMARFFLERLAERGSDDPKRLSRAAMERLINYPWPGNARELFNALEHAHIFARGVEIQLEDLPSPLFDGSKETASREDLDLESIERNAILKALRISAWNRTAACRLLNIELRRLNRRMKHLGIEMHSM